jgi:hypothetical protein
MSLSDQVKRSAHLVLYGRLPHGLNTPEPLDDILRISSGLTFNGNPCCFHITGGVRQLPSQLKNIFPSGQQL